MKSKIKWIVAAVAIGMLVVVTTIAVMQRSKISVLQEMVKEQGEVIDSLLARRMHVYDVSLMVTDRSKYSVGRYNKGTIAMPTEKRYVLQIDSTSVRIK